MPITTIVYNSWEEFKGCFVHDVYKAEEPLVGKRYFRGQRSDSWKLMSSFERAYGNFPNKIQLDGKAVELFKEKLEQSRLLSNTDEIKKDNIVRTIAQHYGLPTNLLDWTCSPYVAAFFAFENPALVNDQNVTIFVLNPSCGIWKNHGCEIVCDYNVENEHQMKQEGVFTLLNHTTNNLEDFVDSYMGADKDKALMRILIPKSERQKAIMDLRLMHIHHGTIYSGIESLARSAIIEAQMIFGIV